MSEDRKIGFYDLVINDFNAFRKWQNTLAFLDTIDERNYIKYFLIPYKKKALCLDEKSKININYSSLMKLIGSDSKVRVDETGDIKDIYWGDTLSSVLYVNYSEFAKNSIRNYLVNKKSIIAEFLSYCDVSDYIEFQNLDGDFVILLDKLIRESKIQKEVSKYLSMEFEKSTFKSEVLDMETELCISDRATDNILPF